MQVVRTMTKEIRTIKQAEKEIERLGELIKDSQDRIVDLVGFIKYKERGG